MLNLATAFWMRAYSIKFDQLPITNVNYFKQ
jgi:hypothetical protein